MKVCTRSAVRFCSWLRDAKAAVAGRGMASLTARSKGVRSSINSSSGGSDRGEKSGYVRECRRRV